jgi:RNA polymerase sigma-70 factor (ECF subfamily)
MSIKSKNSNLDAGRFRELHDKYRERLLQGMIGLLRNRDAAEDVTAAAFAAAFENLGQFRGDSSFYTWLYKIALNEARNPRVASRRWRWIASTGFKTSC